jgi:3-oxoacyl-[acyl-carrier protein] reductase
MNIGEWRNPRFDYTGARVLVTGGTSGIGAAAARAYREAGALVTVTGTRAAGPDYDEDLSGYRYLQLDIEEAAQVASVGAQAGALDILINNAGLALPSLGLDEYDPEIFARAVNMHLTGAYRMSHACADALASSRMAGGGAIICVASMSSYFGIGIVPGYGAAKTGLLGLVRALAVQWGPRGIRVNAVAAGLTESRMTAGAFSDPAYFQPTLNRTPAGRLGTPSDIAGPILFLTSEAASWITGQTLPGDGGFTISG